MKKCKEAIKRLAGNPTDKKIESCCIYGKPIMSYTKKDLVRLILYLETERRRLFDDSLKINFNKVDNKFGLSID